MKPSLRSDIAVLVTGASSGIGRELAREFAARVGTVILTARRRDRLEALQAELKERRPGLRALALPCDLADLASIDDMLRRVRESVGFVSVLVNNAGLGDVTPFHQCEWESVERILNVNVRALVYLTRRLLPDMIERREGGILNVSSGAGHVPMDRAAVYAGSKHFVNGFTETLRLETDGTGVFIAQASPGPVSTEFGLAAGFEDEPPDPFTGYIRISAERCAREIVRGFERGSSLIYPGFRYRQLMRLQEHAPRWTERLLLTAAVRLLKKLG